MDKINNEHLAYCGKWEQTEHRLFCFPFAGGGASLYASWNRILQKHRIQIMPIQLPGRENRYTQKYENNIITLAREAAEGIKDYLDQPFSVFGHSMGGCLAYEFVKYLENEFHVSPKALFVSCTAAPKVISKCVFRDYEPEEHRDELPDDIFMELIRRYNGMDVNMLEIKEYYDYFVPILKRDFLLVGGYHPQNNDEVLSPLHVLYSDGDPDMTEKNLMLWKEYARTVNYQKMEGDHFYINDKTEEVCAYIACHTVGESR